MEWYGSRDTLGEKGRISPKFTENSEVDSELKDFSSPKHFQKIKHIDQLFITQFSSNRIQRDQYQPAIRMLLAERLESLWYISHLFLLFYSRFSYEIREYTPQFYIKFGSTNAKIAKNFLISNKYKEKKQTEDALGERILSMAMAE